MTVKVFIDGAAGTTGLEIRDRLQALGDIMLIQLDERRRKDVSARRAALNEADAVILCLPDQAAREAVALIENPDVRVIDASSAHRVADSWIYGFPELEPGRRGQLRNAARVSNPGCYPTGFLSIIRPLVRAKLIPLDYPVTCHAVSGYSGGGREMIAEFESRDAANCTNAIFRTYGLELEHKHVPEMQVHAGLAHRPLFAPSVGRFYRGMMVEIPLQLWSLPGCPTVRDIHAALVESYHGEALIHVESIEKTASRKTLAAEELKNTDCVRIYVFGNEARRQARVVAVLDNLGKGAAGACVQNLNAMFGWPDTRGLVV